MVQVKICGLTDPTGVEAAITAGADFLGFVFYPDSPRHVTVEQAAYLTGYVPDQIERVGLFVDPDIDFLAQVLNDVPLSMIQLHGQESPAFISQVKAHFSLPVMKAIGVRTPEDISYTKKYETGADWLLLDAKPLQGSDLPGGNGIVFDWKILTNFTPAVPWMLAGGLTPENVTEALSVCAPNAVDVSSGVERAPGVKSSQKINAFMTQAKA